MQFTESDATATTKHEHMATVRIVLERLLDLQRQTIEAAPQIDKVLLVIGCGQRIFVPIQARKLQRAHWARCSFAKTAEQLRIFRLRFSGNCGLPLH